MSKIVKRYWVNFAGLFLVCAAGCAQQQVTVRDAAYVEILRVKISKVRNAIEETRETIISARNARYLPELYLRLAELLSEEAQYHHRLAYEREQGGGKALHVPQVRLLKEQAIGVYKQLLHKYPRTALADQVLFNIGQEQRELGNFTEMQQYLQQIVKEYPDSPLKGEALLVLGDYYFDKGEVAESRIYYEQITKDKPSRVTGLAYYKLAWVWVNLNECDKAIAAFEGALHTARAADQKKKAGAKGSATNAGREPDDGRYAEDGAHTDNGSKKEVSNQGIDVRHAALVDLAYCYSLERKPENSVRYFRSLARDRTTYVEALEKLARRYGVMSEAKGSILVTRELLRLGPINEERIDDVKQLHAALREAKDYTAVGSDSLLIASVLAAYCSRADVSDRVRAEMKKQFELFIRDLLTRAQERLERPQQERQVERAMEIARGYRVYLHAFPQSKAYLDMLLNITDVLILAKDHLEAGRRLLQAAFMVDPRDERRRDILYDAVVSLQNFLHTKRTDVSDLEWVLARSGLRRAASELLRYPLHEDKIRTVKFAIAMTYYDEGNLSEAVDRFTALAYEYPGSEESEISIRLILDAFDTLSDFDSLMRAAQQFLASDSPAGQELRRQISPLLGAAQQRKLDEVSLEAAGDEGGGLDMLVSFARYNQGTSLGERALLNAFLAARAQGDSEQLYKLGEAIIRLYPSSEQLPGLLSTIGQMAVARFEIDRAIAFLARAVKIRHPQQVRLLVTAGELEEQLGSRDQSRLRYQEAIRATDNRGRAEALEHLAKLLEQEGDANRMVAELAPYKEDNNPEALSRLALAQLALGKIQEAETNLQNVLSASASASSEALARAHHGVAEIMFANSLGYGELNSLEMVEEYVAVVEAIQQSYLNAAREGSLTYTPVALGRLAFMSRAAAQRFRTANIPQQGLSPVQHQQVVSALQRRAEQLEQSAQEALTACANQSFAQRSFGPAARSCLSGRAWDRVLAGFDKFARRTSKSEPAGLEELRKRLSRNADDIEALRELGSRFLRAGDPHYARLVFAAAIERGGGAVDANLLGIAENDVQNYSGALSAFARAAEGGLEAGRQNLATLLRKLGLNAAAEDAIKRYPVGQSGGQLLSKGR
ncbi:MAG: tetratricopeptide repeat protein [Deltaproteobacteria bacterium]|nr:tetratricopeptide repeat protein [Deltaproteobacteria bacterium]